MTKEECLDLPPKVYTEIPVPMAAEQRRVYTKLKQELLLEAEGEEVPVLLQLTRLLRLHQIAGGFTVTEDGTNVPIPGTNPKLDALLDDIEVLPNTEQVIIWARFRAEIEAILTERHAGRALRLMDELGILSRLFPELDDTRGCEQPENYHPEGDVFVHTILTVEKLRDEDPVIRRNAAAALRLHGSRATAAIPALAELLTDIDPGVRAEAGRALERLGMAAA